jgi:hypothetical protein
MLINQKFEFIESLDKDQLKKLQQILDKELLELQMIVDSNTLGSEDRYSDYMILRREEVKLLKDQTDTLLWIYTC